VSKVFGWFKKNKSLTLPETFTLLRNNGIAPSDDKSEVVAIADLSEQKLSAGTLTESVMCTLGSEQFDEDTFESKPWLSNDIWHFDYECIEDDGAYVSIIKNCVRLSQNAMKITFLKDHVDIESGEASVQFTHSKKQIIQDLKVDNDWADPKIFVLLNELLEKSGSNRRIAQHDLGQDCLIVCKSEQDIATINANLKMNFFIVKG
jgi:hypothetical protein